MADHAPVVPMHIVITVADFDRAVDFYRDALGFRLGFERQASAAHEPVLRLNNVSFREGFLVLGSMVIALFAFDSPETLRASPHAFNRVGIGAIAFGVADLDATAQLVLAHGGTVLEETRQATPQGTLMLVTDPDGTVLELVQRTG